jgi:hypothetical protein
MFFGGKTSVPYLPSEPNEPNEPNERLCFHQMNQINTCSKNERFFSTNEFISFILWTIDNLGQNPNPSPRRSNSTQKPNKTQRDPNSNFNSVYFGIEINKFENFETQKGRKN